MSPQFLLEERMPKHTPTERKKNRQVKKAKMNPFAKAAG